MKFLSIFLLFLSLFSSSLSAKVGLENLCLNLESIQKRNWIGPDFKANSMQNWSVENGRITCKNTAKGWNSLELRTRFLSKRNEPISSSVKVIRPEVEEANYQIGLLLGHPVQNDRQKPEKGIFAFLDNHGRFYIKNLNQKEHTIRSMKIHHDHAYTIKLSLQSAYTNIRAIAFLLNEKEDVVDQLSLGNIDNKEICDGIALAVFHANGSSDKKFSFEHWLLKGKKIDKKPHLRFGPIAATHYLLSGFKLTLTAHMLPLDESQNEQVYLQINNHGSWATVASANIDKKSLQAQFKIDQWAYQRKVNYRVLYIGTNEKYFYKYGNILPDSVLKSTIKITCLQIPELMNDRRILNKLPALMNRLRQIQPDLILFLNDHKQKQISASPLSHFNRHDRILFLESFSNLIRNTPCLFNQSHLNQSFTFGKCGFYISSADEHTGSLIKQDQYMQWLYGWKHHNMKLHFTNQPLKNLLKLKTFSNIQQSLCPVITSDQSGALVKILKSGTHIQQNFISVPPLTDQPRDVLDEWHQHLKKALPSTKPTLIHNASTSHLPGITLIRMDKKHRATIFDTYHFDQKQDDSYSLKLDSIHWPQKMFQFDFHPDRKNISLPEVHVPEIRDSILEIHDESKDSLIYRYRIHGHFFRPPVFHDGPFTLKIGEPEVGFLQTVKQVKASNLLNNKQLTIRF